MVGGCEGGLRTASVGARAILENVRNESRSRNTICRAESGPGVESERGRRDGRERFADRRTRVCKKSTLLKNAEKIYIIGCCTACAALHVCLAGVYWLFGGHMQNTKMFFYSRFDIFLMEAGEQPIRGRFEVGVLPLRVCATRKGAA